MSKQLVVVALEIGTNNSEYAFSLQREFKRDPLRIHCNKKRDVGFRSHSSMHTPTCLLLDKERTFVAFGYDAENKYADLLYDNEQDDYYFFDRFKKSLYNNENVTRDMVLKDKTGKQCSALEVFTFSIKYLVDCFMKRMQEPTIEIYDDDILWVLTVPAAWTDSGKQLMRESAKRAGLHAEYVLLITEPEASFTYCHYIPNTRLQGSKPGIMITEPGTKSVVVDLGDKEAYITVLQQNYNGKLKDLCRATGDDCGGASVDDRFCNMLEEIAGGNVIAELKRQDPEDWLDLIREFRSKKKTVTTSHAHTFLLTIPLNLMEICQELHGKDFKSVIDSSSYGNDITLVRNKLRFKADLMIKLFTPTIDSIITLMKNTVSNKSTNGISNILMVGGFTKCPMIQEAVYKAFPDNQIIIPDYPEFSGLQGAVLFGHRPDYNRSELCDEEGIGK